VALEIDCDVDAEIAQEACDLGVALGDDIEKTVEGALKPHARVAAVIGPEGNPDHLEALPVVPLEQPGGEIGGGMGAEIR